MKVITQHGITLYSTKAVTIKVRLKRKKLFDKPKCEDLTAL